MGIFDIFKQKLDTNSRNNPAPQKLSFVEKERILVERVTTADMMQFPMIPYQLNGPVHKFIKEGGHPFAYINLNDANQAVAKTSLAQINDYIVQAREYIPLLTNNIFIQINKIVFNEYSPYSGYTRLLCTPYTFTGKLSKFPLCLSFMTRLDSESYTAHGELYYGKDGNVLKADVNIWINPGRRNAVGWFFTFKTIGRTFVLHKVRSTLRPDKNGLPGPVFQLEK